MADRAWARWGWGGSGVWRPKRDGECVEQPVALLRASMRAGGLGSGVMTLLDQADLWRDPPTPARPSTDPPDALWMLVDGATRDDVVWVPPRSYVAPTHDGDEPDWYRDGMAVFPRCEECDEPDSATLELYRASGAERVCRECWLELYGRLDRREPVTRDDLVRRLGFDPANRAVRHAG